MEPSPPPHASHSRPSFATADGTMERTEGWAISATVIRGFRVISTRLRRTWVELPGFHGHVCSRARPSVLAQPPDHHHLAGLNRRRRLSLMARNGPPPRRPGRRRRARPPPRHLTIGLAI